MLSQTPHQELSSDSILETGISPSFSMPPLYPYLDDMNVHIVIHKGVRSSMQHYTSKFVSLSHLSPSICSFSSSASSILVTRNVSQALSQPQWKTTMKEEMKEIEKNRTWEMVNLLQGKESIG